MKHQISTTIVSSNMNFGGAWEQVMTCEFADGTIAELVWEDIRKRYRGHKECLLVGGSIKAELQREGKAITAICGKREYYTIHWDADPDTNQEALEALAQEWGAQEKKWLPIMRYFDARTKEAVNDWAQKWTNRMLDAEAAIKELGRKLDGLDQHQREYHAKAMELFEERTLRIEAIGRLLSLHRDLPFHFVDRKGVRK